MSMKMFIRNIFVLILVLISSLSVSGREKTVVIDDDQLFTQMALLSLDCVRCKDSIPPEKIVGIKNALKAAKRFQKSDTVGVYLRNLLELSYLQFVKKDFNNVYNRSNKLISKYAIIETTSYGFTTHNNTPTWDWFSYMDGRILKKTKSAMSLTSILDFSLDSSEHEEKSFISAVLKELPMTLNDDVYSRYISEYYHLGATSQDLLYFLFRAWAYKKGEIIQSILTIINEDSDRIKQNLLNWGIGCYAICEGDSYMAQLLAPGRQLPTIKALNLESYYFKGFCINLYGTLGVSYKDDLMPLIKEYFGDNSPEYNWIISRDPFLLSDENVPVEEKINASVNLSDSVQLSANIIKGISAYNQQYDYKRAIALGIKWQDKIMPEHKVEYYNLLGFAYRIIAQFDKSINYYEQAITLLDNPKYPKSPVFLLLPKRTQLLTNLAYSYSNAGDYQKAISLLDYEITSDNYGSLDSLLNTKIGDQIFHLEDQGRVISYFDPIRADSLFRLSDTLINSSNYYLTPTNKIWHYISWASVQNRNSLLKRSLISRAEQIFFDKNTNNGLFKVEPIVSGGIYFALGRYYYSIFDYKQASSFYRKAFNTYSLLCDEDRRKTELSLWNCLNRIAMRDTDGIQAVLESQLAMQDSLLGPNHYDCHQTVKGLLKLAIAENNYNLASQYYPRFKRMDGKFGREQFNYGNQLIESAVLSLLGNQKQAYEVADLVDLSKCEPSVGLQALEVKQSLTKSLPLRIQTTELQNINNSAKILSARLFTEVSGQDRVEWSRQLGRLRSGFILNAISPEQIENALDFSLFTKGLLFRTNKYIINLIGKTKKGQASLRELSVINDSIDYHISFGDTIKSSEFRRLYEDMERDMVNQFLTPNVMLTGFQIGKEDAIKNIGKDGLGIDFVKYTQKDSIYYGAFVFAENLPTNFIPLFTENNLVKLITDDSGRRSYEAFDGKHNSGMLYELIWGKLIQFFDGRSDVYFCGDGEIAQLGIEYLTDSKGNKIGDSVKLHRVFHLADVTGDVVGVKDIICMGVANHDFPVSRNGDDVDRGLWCNLNCDKEINDICNTYKKKKGHKSFLIDDEVTEPFVQTLDKNSLSILHISTHGFYYNQDKLRSYARSTNSPDHYLAIRSLQSGKTSLSGLVLRKGNEYRKLPTLPMGYDDIWTSDEIEGLNFPKLQLTVLSACQTGLGQTDSEGVWGLQRAFRIAGTHKLVCALDYVSDKRTREFMSVFYKNLSKGISIYDSFQVARNHLFKHHRDDPRMWSAFVLIE